jgi:hypothetical protein
MAALRHKRPFQSHSLCETANRQTEYQQHLPVTARKLVVDQLATSSIPLACLSEFTLARTDDEVRQEMA